MEIKTFPMLSPAEREDMYNFILAVRKDPHYFSNVQEMVLNYSGATFTYGEDVLIAITKGRVCGTIGIITKGIANKGELFLTAINILPDDTGVFVSLLTRMVDKVKALPYRVLKIGIPPEMSYLLPVVEEQGFKLVYRGLRLKLVDSTRLDKVSLPADLQFERLNHERTYDYMGVSNPAFINSPNGTEITYEEVQEIIAENQDTLYNHQIGYLAGKPAVFFSLRKAENGGWVEALGVHPDFQGQGLGKCGLKRAVEVLKAAGSTDIYLGVMDSNAKAHHFYLQYGFAESQISTVWLEKLKR